MHAYLALQRWASQDGGRRRSSRSQHNSHVHTRGRIFTVVRYPTVGHATREKHEYFFSAMRLLPGGYSNMEPRSASACHSHSPGVRNRTGAGSRGGGSIARLNLVKRSTITLFGCVDVVREIKYRWRYQVHTIYFSTKSVHYILK